MSEREGLSAWIPEWLLAWTADHPDFLRYALIGSAVAFVASLVGLPLLVSTFPVDYFAEKRAPASILQRLNPVLCVLLVGLKNLAGALFLLAGLVMLVTPGQGLLSILIGLSLLSFPGKRRLELWIVRKPKVLAALNWMRAKTGKPPFDAPYSSESSPVSSE